MRIDSIELINFGPHTHFKDTLSPGVVMVTGDNGGGKSHLILALEFLFQGSLPGKNEDAVTLGKSNGKVICTFTHNGKQGRIMRTLKGSERELQWDGQRFTKAAEVEDQLEALLGIDKEAFKSSCFIRQGELKNVLFGTEAVRRDILIRLLNLDFVRQKYQEVDRARAAFRDKHIDEAVYGRRQELENELDTLREELKTAEQKVEDAGDYGSDLFYLEQNQSLHKQLKNEEASLEAASQLLEDKPTGLEDTEKSLQQQKTKAQTRLSAVRTQIDDLSTRLQDHAARATVEEELGKVNKELTEAQSGLSLLPWDELRKKLPDLPENPDDSYVDSLRDMLALAKKGKRIQEASERAQAVLLEATKALHAFRNKDKPRIQELETELSEVSKVFHHAQNESANLQSDLQTIERIKAKTDLSKCSPDECVTCTTCKLDIFPVRLLNDEYLDLMRANLKKEKDAAAEAKQKIETLKTDLETLHSRGQQAEANHANAVKNMGELESLTDAEKGLAARVGDEEEFSTNLRTLQYTIQRRDQLMNTSKSCLSKIQDYTKRLKALGDVKQASDVKRWSSERDTLREEGKELERELEQLDKELQEIGPAIRELGVLKDKVEWFTKERIPQIQKELQEIQPPPSFKNTVSVMGVDDPEALIPLLRDKVEERAGLVAQVQASVKSIERVRERLKEVEESINQQRRYKYIYDVLTELKDQLSPEGLVKRYIQYHFRYLSKFTGRHLLSLGANFYIRPSEDTPISYEFQRTGEDNKDGWLDMSRLSGGQKVKLGLAFVLAVQEQLCSDLDFISLDEPSTHLDQRSVEALGDTLMELTQSVAQRGGQYWIVDHHDHLRNLLPQSININDINKQNQTDEPDTRVQSRKRKTKTADKK